MFARLFFTALLTLGFFAHAVTAADAAGKRLALLVGNKNYKLDSLDLTNPHNDIAVVGKALKAAGFELIIVKDAGFGKMQRAVKRYARRLRELGPDATGFFYYSGHGALNHRSRSNYIIPTDVDTTENEELWDSSVRLKRIIDELKSEAPKAVHFVVFDACRNELKLSDPKSKSLVKPKGFQPIRRVSGMLIAYATAEGETASDVGTGAGPYARALAAAIATPGIEAVQMFRNVQLNVHREIGQEPWFTFGALRQVFLSGQKDAAVATTEQLVITAWERAKGSKSIAVLNAFRSQYGAKYPVFGAPAAEEIKRRRRRLASAQSTSPATTSRPDERVVPKFVSIGTGGVTGVYYPTGGAICRLVNKTRKNHGIRCSSESTGGSIYNIRTLRKGELQFGIAQSDWQYHAYEGTTSRFKNDGPFKKLRSVFSVHAEPVTMFARNGTGIANITDLKGKRVNVGNLGSGTLGTWQVIKWAMGWNRSFLGKAFNLKSSETGQALCDDKIDAFFWLVGHPSALTQDTLIKCPAHLVHIRSAKIDMLIRSAPYYRKAIIPAGMYNNTSDIETFGVGATVVTSADVSEDVVYNVVKSVFDGLDRFRRLHPAFRRLKPPEMIRDSLSAPLHAGAARYYKEQGWLH